MPSRLTPEEVVSIQTLAKKGVPVRQIARQLDRNESTVRYHASKAAVPPREDGRRGKQTNCDRVASVIEAWIENRGSGHRPPNLRELYEDLVEHHQFKGSYKSVVRWVRKRWARPPIRTYRRVETPPGAQAQSDWGHFKEVRIARQPVKPMAFVMALSFSRMMSVAWSPRRDLLCLLDCHNRTFVRLGGIPATNRVDNEKTMVVQGAGSRGQVHPVYSAYARTMGFHVDPCGARQPQAKGKSEAKVKLTRRFGPKRMDYDSWEELDEETATEIEAYAKRTNCPATGKRIWDTWEEERELLRPLPRTMPEPFDCVVQRQVHKDCTIAFEGRQYGVNFRHVGRSVEVRGTSKSVEIYFDGGLVNRYERGTESRILTDPSCYDGEATEHALPPPPLGKLGAELERIASAPVQMRAIDIYARLAEVAR